MDDRIRTAMAAYEPKRIEREGMARAVVLVAVYDRDDVPDLNRVAYNTSSKPPGTIEWE